MRIILIIENIWTSTYKNFQIYKIWLHFFYVFSLFSLPHTPALLLASMYALWFCGGWYLFWETKDVSLYFDTPGGLYRDDV